MSKTPQQEVVFLDPRDIEGNPVQNELLADRVKNIGELKKQFKAFAEQYGNGGFNPAHPVTVRFATTEEQKNRKIHYIAIEGHRRITVARNRGEQVAAVIDHTATPETDLVSLKRVIMGDEGYTQIERANILGKMIESGMTYQELKREVDAELLMRILAFRGTPEELQDQVKNDPSKFTKLGVVTKTIMTKPAGALEFKPAEGVSKEESEAAIRLVMSRDDLNSEKARQYAMSLRDQLKEKKLMLNKDGELVPTARYQRFGINQEHLNTKDEIRQEFNRAIDRIRRDQKGLFNSKTTFDEALRDLMEKYGISVEQLTLALDRSRPYTAQLLNRTSHPSAENLAKLRTELLYRGLDEATVDQLWLLGERDRHTLPTKRAEIAEQYKFKSGQMLKRFIEDLNITQKDIATRTRVGVGHLSNILSDKSFPTDNQVKVLSRFLRTRGVSERKVEVWKTAVLRDTLLSFMALNKGFSAAFLKRAVKSLDEEFRIED